MLSPGVCSEDSSAGSRALACWCGRGPRNVEEAGGSGHSWDTCAAEATAGLGVPSGSGVPSPGPVQAGGEALHIPVTEESP